MAIIHYDVVFEKGSPSLLAIKEKIDQRMGLRTRIGVGWRATVSSPKIAASFGIDPIKVRYLNFAIGSALAAVAGGLVALLNNLVDPVIGYVVSATLKGTQSKNAVGVAAATTSIRIATLKSPTRITGSCRTKSSVTIGKPAT